MKEAQCATLCSKRVKHLEEGCDAQYDLNPSSSSCSSNVTKDTGQDGNNTVTCMHNNRGKPTPSFEEARLTRLVVGHLLRSGFVETAELVAKAEGVQVRGTQHTVLQQAQLTINTPKQELVDCDIFAEMHTVARAILKHNVEPALEWCSANASRLRRIQVPQSTVPACFASDCSPHHTQCTSSSLPSSRAP